MNTLRTLFVATDNYPDTGGLMVLTSLWSALTCSIAT